MFWMTFQDGRRILRMRLGLRNSYIIHYTSSPSLSLVFTLDARPSSSTLVFLHNCTLIYPFLFLERCQYRSTDLEWSSRRVTSLNPQFNTGCVEKWRAKLPTANRKFGLCHQRLLVLVQDHHPRILWSAINIMKSHDHWEFNTKQNIERHKCPG